MNKEKEEQITQQRKALVPYKIEDNKVTIDVYLDEETVWLTPKQMAELFQKGRPTILEHIYNIYKEEELEKDSTCRKSRQVQIENKRRVSREIDYYNLDVIISVGYRVKSKRGTQFRIWATKVLKERLLSSYKKNQPSEKELAKVIKLIGDITEGKKLAQDEAVGLLNVITDYTYALDLLDDFDYRRLQIKETVTKEEFKITYAKAVKVIKELKSRFGSSQLFGKEKDDSFRSSIGNIYQTFNGTELYPSLVEKAAHLLYFLIKNHSFVDGNKRIGASIFLWFLKENKILYHLDGTKRIADNALVALALLIAESNPKEKDTIVKVIVNLINKKN
jgi:prophage maintenance system killer protein